MSEEIIARLLDAGLAGIVVYCLLVRLEKKLDALTDAVLALGHRL